MNILNKLCLHWQKKRLAKQDAYYAELKRQSITSINKDLALLYRQREIGSINLYGKNVQLIKPRLLPSSLVN